jgi:hypothetical protein
MLSRSQAREHASLQRAEALPLCGARGACETSLSDVTLQIQFNEHAHSLTAIGAVAKAAWNPPRLVLRLRRNGLGGEGNDRERCAQRKPGAECRTKSVFRHKGAQGGSAMGS